MFEQLLLHAVAVVLETFVVATAFTGGVEQVESLKNVVGEWMAALGFT